MYSLRVPADPEDRLRAANQSVVDIRVTVWRTHPSMERLCDGVIPHSHDQTTGRNGIWRDPPLPRQVPTSVPARLSARALGAQRPLRMSAASQNGSSTSAPLPFSLLLLLLCPQGRAQAAASRHTAQKYPHSSLGSNGGTRRATR
jgi:hypothetical protein